MNFFSESFIQNEILRNSEQIEQKLREAIEAHLGKDFDIEELRGRVHKISSPSEDSYYLDGELVFQVTRRDLQEEFWRGP